MAGRQQRVLTDHDEIREWAEGRNASPACVRGTGSGGDVGMIRLDFPGYSGETSLEHIDWDEWLGKFDQNSLALLVEDTTAGGQKSNFNKLVSRETAAQTKKSSSPKKASGAKKAAAKKSSAKKAAPRKASSAKKSTSSRNARGSSHKTASRSRGR